MSIFHSKTVIRKSSRLCIFAITLCILLLTGCSAMKQRAADTKARETFESGGYTWAIPADTAGGNTIRTRGLPSQQIATTAIRYTVQQIWPCCTIYRQEGQQPCARISSFQFQLRTITIRLGGRVAQGNYTLTQ